ncbi:LacI family DNA-binding transcriptional regulator [Humibacter sp. RRB41]|uniref:LacI family DNA-binding transcriptional regulator n=1 Tax=Humibacter sp. RRB41 TaxID=2919946 RepID=UPI001FAA03D7|nr:LacI family DNA-binding transcriptional regulator [Humibacter sp. RRB41]
MPARVTIKDVALAAGVSKGAASNALNDRPGVSETTRQRVKDAAERLGWSPNRLAQALSGSRGDSVGWAIVRTAKTPAIDPYFTELFSGIELELETTDLSLVTKLVADREAEAVLYRRWASERRVAGVLISDIDVDEPRFEQLRELETPFVAFRSTTAAEGAMPAELRVTSVPEGLQVPTVWFQELTTVATLLDHARTFGHRRIAWVSGDPSKAAVVLRERAVDRWSGDNGVAVRTVYTDYSPSAGAQRAVELLRSDSPPTFIVFDSDIMALAGLSALNASGYGVPRDVSVASFIDSTLCEVALPPVTALAHPVVEYGRAFTRRLIQQIGDGTGTDAWLEPPTLVKRASVGPAPAPAR